MRTLLTLAAVAALTMPLSAQMDNDPDKAVAGGGKLPAGWSARTDRGAAMDNVKFETMGSGLHVTLGPAVVLWQAKDAVTGPFHMVASFNQTKAPTHAESYGLFFAGKDLKGEGQSYTYFLIRKDGKFLVKTRTGATTANVTEGWVENAAVVKEDATGKQANKLEVAVGKDKVTFSVNGTVVHTMAGGMTDGIAGLRINHNLDLHIAGFGVHKM